MAVTYRKMNQVLKNKRMSMADLRKKADISPNTMTRIRRDEEVTMDVLCRICSVLQVDFGDIVEYLPD